jgi:hypothetical protein
MFNTPACFAMVSVFLLTIKFMTWHVQDKTQVSEMTQNDAFVAFGGK